MKLYELKITLGGLFEANSNEEVADKWLIESERGTESEVIRIIDFKINSLGELDEENKKVLDKLNSKEDSNVVDLQAYRERRKL